MTRRRASPAMRFLWIIAGLTLVFVAGAFLYRLFETDLMRWAMVPRGEYRAVAMPVGASYADRRLWIARPDIAGHPGSWRPAGLDEEDGEGPRAAIFFVHPTSFLETSAWNGAIDHPESQQRAALFVRSQASAFNAAGEIWAPRYRQAAFGAFLNEAPSARRALELAYRDVAAAYEHFIAANPRGPIILAGHSQGSLHLLRLLLERVKDAPEARRIVAVYAAGWPVSETADLPLLPFPACQRPDQPRCLLSWQSFAEPANAQLVTGAYDRSRSAAGVERAGSPMLCVNPLTGTRGGIGARESNRGTLIPDVDLRGALMQSQRVPARCDARGFLLIGDNDRLPAMGPYVLPGNNYHVYDYALFWANLRADARRRLAAFVAGGR